MLEYGMKNFKKFVKNIITPVTVLVCSVFCLLFSPLKAHAADQWFEPYEQFGVDNIFDLMPRLKEVRISEMSLTPTVYNKLGNTVEISRFDPIFINLSNGANVKYFMRIDDSNSSKHVFTYYDLTLTFIGDGSRDALIRVSSKWVQRRAADGSIINKGFNEDCEIFIRSGTAGILHDKKCIKIDCGIPYTLEFNPDFVCISDGGKNKASGEDIAGSYDLSLKNSAGKKVSDITLLMEKARDGWIAIITGDDGLVPAAHIVKGTFSKDSGSFYGQAADGTAIYFTMDMKGQPEIKSGTWTLRDSARNTLESWTFGPNYELVVSANQ